MEHGFTWLHALPFPEHITTAVLVALLLVVFALRVRPKLTDTEAALDPDDGVVRHHYERYVPLLAAFFVFILVANLIGLVPGFVPPTSNFNVTLGLGVISFLAYNYYGIKSAGIGGHLKHFMGPVLLLAPLMFIVEIFSHSFRPISLGIRLFANMFADHEVVSIFTSLTKLGVPVIFY